MDIWVVIKERYVIVSFLIVLFLLSLFSLVAIKKSRLAISKKMATMQIIFFVFLIIVSLLGLLFTISFGYNS